ncbi:MAG: SPFH domain-containing protein [Methylicorpusculum sp.]|uniref:SPFH domain-containing protein n=1 Tax=Methylicorpusculum sp. TaxID=2713644 RepID=UPI00271817F9|nr:SPFH domain-containing protein [Methylicorpusculum sp.]MDO8845296.1 SPFH domain-containing protein [Methylicorpusculum sp.]MDO8940963.1 SPFH domain-containing protein [Methylicorpusculum sp.]MDP2200856.1 SPFH domain-containing protein [Methylicorpusculum sp.]
MEGLYIAAAFVGLVVITVFKGVRVVPQGYKHIVQRLGKYYCTLTPGLNFIVPYIDSVTHRITTKDIVMDIPAQEVITQDNAVIVANAIAYINIVSPEKAVYGVEDYELAIQKLIQTALRAIIGEMALDSALSSRDMIKEKLKAGISDDISDWGITLKTVEIQDINPSKTMQASMEEQSAAERQRRAAVTRAEGAKQAAILEAEGRLEASLRDAKAKVVLAEASARSIESVTAAVKDNELPVTFLLGEKYIEAMRLLSQSDNAKTIVLPADLLQAVKGMMDKVR